MILTNYSLIFIKLIKNRDIGVTSCLIFNINTRKCEFIPEFPSLKKFIEILIVSWNYTYFNFCVKP